LTKVLSYYKSKNVNIVIITSLIVSIIVTNSFVIFSSDENTRFYNAGLTSALTVGVGLVICLIQVYRYKRSIHRQEGAGKPHHYFDNNKMHLSICLFLGLWFTAHMIWVLEYQQSSGVSIADALWFVGYASFGYFLFNLYHHFFRKEFEPFVLILVAIIIAIALIFVLDSIVSILRLLSTQTVDLSVMLVTLVYPILDAVLFFPAVLIFWAVRRGRSRNIGKDTTIQEQKVAEAKLGQGKTSFSSPLVTGTTSVWILLLSIAMMLSAIADTGYAYSAAYGPDTVQKEVWIWDIIYNADHLCLAAALIGYRHFFSFYRHDIGYNTEDTHTSSPKEEEEL
jgi:hypothetical protein